MASLFKESGPHIESPETIENNMWGVSIALIPALILGVYFFGLYALYIVLAAALSAVLFEKPFVKSKNFFGDGSAFLAGFLLGLSLPPTVPWWLPILGGFLAVVIGKHLFGGLGSNIFNPALVARAILLLAYPALMVKWISPLDGVAAATPLELGPTAVSYSQLIIGNISGSIGETSVLALVIGGFYLYLKKYIDLKIPLSFIAGSAGAAFFFGQDPIFAVFSGGIIFASIYMATDMVTSPVAKWARIIYGLLGGFLTIFIRRYTPYPGGVTFAILIINGASYFFDNLFEGPHFGEVELVKKKVAHFSAIALAAVLILLVGLTLVDQDDPYPNNLTYSHLQKAVPTAVSFEISERNKNDILFTAKREGQIIKELVYVARNGFEAPIEILLVLKPEAEIEDLIIVNESESPTLGAKIKAESFLLQFKKFGLADADQIINKTDLISGATYSSQTVARAVQSGLELLVSEKESVLQAGSYQGRAEGAKGEIVLELVIEEGDIIKVNILKESETEHLADPAYQKLKSQLLSQQNLELDIVSGATYTSEAFIKAAKKALNKAQPDSAAKLNLKNGEYIGSAQGHVGEIKLKVVIEAQKIKDIDILSQNETAGLGDQAIEKIINSILAKQSLAVDTISGATNSSAAAIKAVENALNRDSKKEAEKVNSEIIEVESDTDSAATWQQEEEQTEPEENKQPAEQMTSAVTWNSNFASLSQLNLKDAEYRGSAQGHRSKIEVSVLVEASKLQEVRIVSQAETPGIGDQAMAELSSSLVSKQNLKLDTVSGATNSSVGFLKAVNNALTSESYGSLQTAEDLRTAQEIIAAENEKKTETDTNSAASSWDETETDAATAEEGGSNE